MADSPDLMAMLNDALSDLMKTKFATFVESYSNPNAEKDFVSRLNVMCEAYEKAAKAIKDRAPKVG